MKNAIMVVTVGVLTLVSSVSSRAALQVYEGFDYTADTTIALLTGGSGWAAPGWLNSSANRGATNKLTSLSYTDGFGNTLLTSGGKLDVGFLSGTTANAERTMATTYSSGTYWISFLANRVGPTEPGGPTNYARQSAVALFNSTGERLDFGRPNTANFAGSPFDTWTVWTNTGSAVPTVTSKPLNVANSSLMLVRIDLDAANGLDSVRLWVNPSDITIEPLLGTEDALITTPGTGMDMAFNRIRLNANGGNTAGAYAEMLVDEFRLGTGFLDVVPLVPEPQVWALAALGGLAFWARWRKGLRSRD